MTYARYRFRWAVCQIDALRRLKCDQHIVKNALKNLPRTLYETYDKILIAIPEDERLVVHHVLQWIAHHNEVYGCGGIPCEILIQAVEASTRELTGDRNERFYDSDSLREVCGCLIDIFPRAWPVELGGPGLTYISVTFAHYTVCEYLDSSRILNTVYAHHSAGKQNLGDFFLRITMSEAQHIEQNELWELENDDPNDPNVFEAFVSDFNSYCAISALLSLYNLPGQVCQQGMLSTLAIDLLDPSKPHFVAMELAASTFEYQVSFFGNRDVYRGLRFWEVQWHPGTSTEAIHLYNLLVGTEYDRGCVPLAKTFLQEKDLKGLFQTRLRFEREVISNSWDEGQSFYTFDGPLIEVFAQLSMESMEPFKVLIDIGPRLVDPSMALLLSICGHDHNECKDFCPVERFLELGADPNLKDYEVTPLQISTFSLDFEGVSTLLKGGAHPDYPGSSDGVAWEEDTLMSHFNHLYGASPLRIDRSYECIPIAILQDPGERTAKRLRRFFYSMEPKKYSQHKLHSTKQDR